MRKLGFAVSCRFPNIMNPTRSCVETQVQIELASFPDSIPSALNKNVINHEAVL